jgi:hypothetical protein
MLKAGVFRCRCLYLLSRGEMNPATLGGFRTSHEPDLRVYDGDPV